MKFGKNKTLILISLLLLIYGSAYAQGGLYFSPGIGLNYSKTDLTKLQNSYTSYLAFLDLNFPTDPYQADANWSSTSLRPTYSFQLGLNTGSFTTGLVYFYSGITQTRNVNRESGFGRKFVWHEQRHEVLVDFGYGSEKFDVFGSLGANMNNYKMSSYVIYPSGALSMTNEFNFNGNFRQFDAGMSYGLGIKYKPIKYLALDLRYIWSSDKLLGESDIGDEPALSDNSFAREPGTSQYPQDYTQPLTLENEIVSNFKHSNIILSVLIHLNFE